MKHHHTEKELLQENQRQLYQVNKLITQKVLSLNDLKVPQAFNLD
jgi:hypothetical protein